MMMNMYYFISDAHLGSRAMTDPEGHQQKLVDLLRGMEEDAKGVFLLGDIFDFWFEYLWECYPKPVEGCADAEKRLPTEAIPYSKRPFAPVLQQLRRMTDKGIKVHFFIGNHDIWTFGGLARMTGVTVHRRGEEITLNGKRCYLAHGDGLVPSGYIDALPKVVRSRIKRFIFLRSVFHHPAAQALFRLVPPVWGDAFGYEWAKRSRLKELANPFPYKGENREELVLWAKEQEGLCAPSTENQEPSTEHRAPRTDYYIFGHRHIELDLQLASQSRVVILGDFFRQFTYASLDADGGLMLSVFE